MLLHLRVILILHFVKKINTLIDSFYDSSLIYLIFYAAFFKCFYFLFNLSIITSFEYSIILHLLIYFKLFNLIIT